jgi:RNA polymerase sigma factor (sigma-70 family)
MKEEGVAQLDLPRVVEGIRSGDAASAKDLYTSFRWLRSHFAAKLGWQEADDRYHDLIVATVTGIKSGALRDPARLAGYMRVTARNMIAGRFTACSKMRQLELDDRWLAIKDDRPSVEATTIRREAKDIATRILDAMPLRDRTVLMRFYVDEHRPEQICSEMSLSPTQFRLIKSRAKARFTSLMQRRIGPGWAISARPNRKMA